VSGFESFHFLRPAWLAAVLLLVPVAWLALRRPRASAAWQKVCDPGLLRHLALDGAAATSRPALAAVFVGFTTACLAAAGPSWERLPTPTYEDPLQTVLVLSLVDSMRTRDVSSSRLVRARHKILDALERVDGSVGLVIFAEEPYAVTPLTDDAKVIAQQVPLLEPSLMPGRGAHVGRALDEAHRLLAAAGASHGRILLLGDSVGDDPKAALAAASRSADAGFPVSVLGIGEDSQTLEAVAQAGDGRFAGLRADDGDLQSLLATDDLLHAFDPRRTQSNVQADAWRDTGAWLVLVPLLLMPLAFRRGWAGALGLAAFMLTSAPTTARAEVVDWFARPDQRAADAFDRGDVTSAAELFDDPAWRGAAQYRDGRYQAAIETLQGRQDVLSQYNLGNALARANQLEQALAAYDNVLEQEPEHEDAAFNRQLVEQMLEQPQQQDPPPQEQESEEQESSGDSQQESGGSGAQDEAGESGPQQGDADPREGDTDQGQGDAGQQEQSHERAEAAPSEQAPGDASQQQQAEQQQEGAESQPHDASDTAAGEAEPSAGSSDADLDPTAQSDRQEGTPPSGAGRAPVPSQVSESDQEVEQWLNRVPDDPGALLREKLRRRYVERRTAASRHQGARR
jgi:Ca-activated chloride channel family protein